MYLFDRIYYGLVSHNFSSCSSYQCKNNSGTNRWIEKLDVSKQINIMKGSKNRKIHNMTIKFYINVVNTERCVAHKVSVGSLMAGNILNEIIVAGEA